MISGGEMDEKVEEKRGEEAQGWLGFGWRKGQQNTTGRVAFIEATFGEGQFCKYLVFHTKFTGARTGGPAGARTGRKGSELHKDAPKHVQTTQTN